ncbi:MAG: HNH endonuclease [Bosea sp.]|nr:HNH endonuclease signature motif containing protein [Bosea sp. (in: a-proteobacteria)]MBN9472280.1 HNH endonuclease [Bosea sp. (in: a-proteobacteria)]
MPSLPPKHRLARISPVTQRKQVDARRGSARDRGYSARWDRASLAFKAQHPLCIGCEARGKTVPTDVVDHIVPHRGDQDLFWDIGNWQPCCRICHDRVKARLEVMWSRGEIGASALRLTSKRAMAIGREVFGDLARMQGKEGGEPKL